MKVRPIRADDDQQVADVIRTVMPEFGASGLGFAIHDAEVDHMSAAYAQPRSAYFVLDDGDGRVLGGGGIAPLAGGPDDTCELRKMYFRAEARGRGFGKQMLVRCLDTARAYGFAVCYLETLTGMNAAQRLYEQVGFLPGASAMGATGHFACDRYYSLSLR